MPKTGSINATPFREATATFWRTLHHDGKISLVPLGWGVHSHPPITISTIIYKIVVYAPAERAPYSHHISTLPLYVLCKSADRYW
jgi:hypothetical protein